MRRLPRPKLVFWRFWASIQIIPFFVKVLIRDLTYVMYCSIWTTSVLSLFLLTLLTRLCCIDSGGRGGAFLMLVLAKLLGLLLFFFVGLLGGLSLILRSQCFGLLGFRPRLLCSKISYWVALDASPSAVESIAMQTLVVSFFDVGGGLQASLDLDINHFLYNLGPTV